ILAAVKGQCFFYTVVSGDTCTTIGNRFGVSANSIIAANPQVNAGCTNLVPGEVSVLCSIR
ncbi:hypothetical protein AN958_00253, partial [Leucoagaricus sp. SymC.cos]